MPTPPDPAPCDEDEQLFECTGCGTRLCSAERVTTCPDCDSRMRNLTTPRAE